MLVLRDHNVFLNHIHINFCFKTGGSSAGLLYSVKGLWSHQESNLDLKFRKLLFYPLNYETFAQIYKNILIK